MKMNIAAVVAVIALLALPVSAFQCLQETPTVAPVCGGFANGSAVGIMFDNGGAAAYDGNYSTYDQNQNGPYGGHPYNVNLSVKYARPANLQPGTQWQVKFDNGIGAHFVNITLPASCMNSSDNFVHLAAYNPYNEDSNDHWVFNCYNNTGVTTLLDVGSLSLFGKARFYEEAIIWNFTDPAAPVPHYKNINTGEGVGYTAQVIVKGVAQIGSGTLDSALASSNDLTGLLALGLVIAALGFIVVGTASLKGGIKKVI